MFDQLVESTNKAKTNKVWSFWVSVLAEALILFILILIPLIYTSALPKALLNSTFLAAPPPPPPPPPPPAVVHVVHQKPVFQKNFVAPTVIPKRIEKIVEQPQQPDIGMVGGVVGGVPGGSSGGVIGGIIGGTGPAPPPKPSAPLRVGGAVMAAKALYEPPPQYPQIAKMAHVSGTVILHAIIAEDGTIQQLTFISGPALLRNAAMEAVRTWRYKPTLLDGQPTKVDTTISVVFTLGGE